jgi:hypothetical protein
VRQFEGNWRIEARREGAARLILQSGMGEQVYLNLSPNDLNAMRSRLSEMLSPPPITADDAETLKEIENAS